MFEIMNTLPMILAENTIELDSRAFGMLGGVIGCGLIVMGAAKGIGSIEGVTLFALIICMLAVIGE